jgi:hypothetical protein
MADTTFLSDSDIQEPTEAASHGAIVPVSSLFSSLAARFDIPWDDLEEAGEEAEKIASFREMLADRLRFIIDYQFSRLPQILYRIDVDERSVDEVFRYAPISEVPNALADLIIARVLRTIETRRRYRETVTGAIGEGE